MGNVSCISETINRVTQHNKQTTRYSIHIFNMNYLHVLACTVMYSTQNRAKVMIALIFVDLVASTKKSMVQLSGPKQLISKVNDQ